MKTKYNRSMHLPFSPGTTSDDRIAKSVDPLLNVPVIISEKLDGENCGMTREGVYARSHATFTTSPWSVMVRTLHSVLKNDIEEGTFVFGENMEGIHSIEFENLTSPFYIFGIRKGSTWLSWKEVEEFSFLTEVPTVPVLFKGIFATERELTDKVMQLVAQESALGGKREGIVIRLAESFDDADFSTSLMKWVRKGHVTTSEHWTKTWRKARIKNWSC